MVNPNYKEINAKEQLARRDSVFHYFQRLLRLRKEHETIVYGTYDLLLPDSKEIYAYTRTLGEEQLLVVCNFTGEHIPFEMPERFLQGEVLIQNYKDTAAKPIMELRPYEAAVFMRRQAV